MKGRNTLRRSTDERVGDDEIKYDEESSEIKKLRLVGLLHFHGERIIRFKFFSRNVGSCLAYLL